MEITQHTHGSDGSTPISNLLLVIGNSMRPGTGAYPLRENNNVQGASHRGAIPNLFPGNNENSRHAMAVTLDVLENAGKAL